MPSVLWRCWLGGRKGIRPVKTEWCGAGMVICLERGADLHMAQLMPLPLTVTCFSKIQIGFTFLVLPLTVSCFSKIQIGFTFLVPSVSQSQIDRGGGGPTVDLGRRCSRWRQCQRTEADTAHCRRHHARQCHCHDWQRQRQCTWHGMRQRWDQSQMTAAQSQGRRAYDRLSTHTHADGKLTDWVVVLHPTRHKIGKKLKLKLN